MNLFILLISHNTYTIPSDAIRFATKVATSYTPNVATSNLDAVQEDEYGDGEEPMSEISEEYQDGGDPASRPDTVPGQAETSEGSLDNYADYEEPQGDNGPPSPDRYRDRDSQVDVDMSAPVDFSNPTEEEYHEHEQQEDIYYQQQYEEQVMATGEDDWGEQKQEIYKDDYQDYPDPPVATYTSSGDGNYEAPPDAAESDVSGNGDDDYTNTSSQKYIAMAKKMAGEEPSRRKSERDDAIEDISDGEEAHSQAKAYRHRAQAERIGRKSRVSDLINRFESS